MTTAALLLRARTIGIRDFRNRLFKFIKKSVPLIITEYGEPTSVLLPYEDMLEIVDVLDELHDEEAVKAVAEGRKAVKKGAKGISASKVLKSKKGG